MSNIPSAKGFDHTLALLRNPYGYISDTCRELETDLFETRILLQRTICLTGAAAAEVFYNEDRLVRSGAMPVRIQKTLLGEGGVQGLDGEAHRHRKSMFMSLMGADRIAALRDVFLELLEDRVGDWERAGEIVLYDEMREILTRAVCDWSGVPLPAAEVQKRTKQLTALFQDAGTVGPKHWAARQARDHAEHWAASLIQQVRGGSLKPTEESALHVIATWRDLNGEVLEPKVAAVELLNVLRPTVAVSVFIVDAAQALIRHPEWAAKLQQDERYLDPFVQEVRRLYPFFPAVAAQVASGFDWGGYHFETGRRVMLDLHGTNTDPRSWDAPRAFRPERFIARDETSYNFIPQGGGDHHRNHRCPGEWVTTSLMKAFCAYFVSAIDYDVPEQNLDLDTTDLPALPKDRFILTNVRRRK